jgi:hypothetical protein
MVPRLLAPYRATCWDLLPHGDGPVAVIGAWNPGSRLLSRSANLSRERRLRQLLPRRQRAVVGAAADDSWRERMWLIPHQRTRTLGLLRCFGQYAALERAGGVWRLFWVTGQRSVIAPVKRRPRTP